MVSLKILIEGEWIFILETKKLKIYTKEIIKFLSIIILGILLILAIFFIIYKPAYEVKIEGKTLGFVKNKNSFINKINEEIINKKEKNIAYVSIINNPEYEKVFITRKIATNEDEIIEKIRIEDVEKTYCYYEVALNNEVKSTVDTMEDAETIVKNIKDEFKDENYELDIQINEKYTTNSNEINTEKIEVASNIIEKAATEIIEDSKTIAQIKDVKIASLPVVGSITSRYGEVSSLRSHVHGGLDIAAATGKDIKAVSKGIVTYASNCGGYGNLVKIDHGDGVETYYGHCSKIYVKVGQEVQAGDVIAAVGSTGYSTGPHLHFEIRIDGKTIDPQEYMY